MDMSQTKDKITSEVAKKLKYYVYVYIDPRNGKPFYIGKGRGNRIFSHLQDKSDTEKVERIEEIKQSGKKPRIEILCYGLSNSEAHIVEAAAIDLIGKSRLTNRMGGHHRATFGRISGKRAMSMFQAKNVKAQHKAILLTINKYYRSDMTKLELYEMTRGAWITAEAKRNKVEYAFALYQGIVLEVYRIKKWYPAGTLKYRTRNKSDFTDRRRWEFSGTIANDIRDQYVDYSIGKGGSNPVRYVNI
jgi:uncharacterized protein